MSLTLRPYQHQAISELRASYREGARAPLLVLPTGGGKTIVMAEILRSLADRGRNGLVLVHRRELIAQTSHKLDLTGVAHGIIAAGYQPTNATIQVASVQTLARRIAQLTWAPDLIVVDEAHHAVAGTWAAALQRWPDAYRLGVTATPVRQDGRGLLQPVVASACAQAREIRNRCRCVNACWGEERCSDELRDRRPHDEAIKYGTQAAAVLAHRGGCNA